RAEILSWIPELTGIINQAEVTIDDELLALAPKLRIVANVALGIDNLNLKLLSERKIWGTNTPNAFGDSTADFTLAMILAVTRRVCSADAYVKSGQWKSFQPGVWDGDLLSGRTLGIVGYGRIGEGVARRARGFGMKIIFHRRTRIDDPGYRELDDLLKEADIVSLHTPLSKETEKLISRERLALMKPEAYLVNMARGRVVDQEALIEALKAGRLRGAALDVFEEEPNVPTELFQMDNVVLTPHIGGGSRECRFSARHLCAANIAAVLDGKPPLTPVNSW
ncbi:MAG: D-glycerate dehydrogenase, partial [Opitutaceae bacterium]|nr:D-glycerate dehydrogenase [Opitutaceae bacterium]